MTTLVAERVERPASLFGPAPEEAEHAVGAGRRDHDLGGGRLTLDDAIVGAWEGLAARVAVACPLCGGALRPEHPPDGVAGCCTDCGTTLA
ncbi:MAG TPA: hypothetical protein VN635_08370 [Conexibacter sp.]|nr:hypothetical protein [Conexibacter sp.]